VSFLARLRRVAVLLGDPRTPALPRIAVVLAVLYLLWPVDLVPEALSPLVGYLDDLVVVWLALRWLLKSGNTAAPHRRAVDQP
jgi:uncharacterized membrane protein YkvA (DUF1232 family)